MYKKYEDMPLMERSKAMMSHYNDFEQRLDEIGIKEYVTITLINSVEDNWQVLLEVDIEACTKNGINGSLVCYVVMGLISHFINRNWAKNWSYTYIMKSRHSITFYGGNDN